MAVRPFYINAVIDGRKTEENLIIMINTQKADRLS